MDKTTLNKIILIKQTYNRAQKDSKSSYRYLKRIQAVIGFDWATEAIIKTAIRKFDSRVKFKNDLNDLVKQCNSLLQSNQLQAISDIKELSHVRKIRNQAQHEARYPNNDELQDCRIYTRDFLREFVFYVWNVKWDDISMADAIEHPEVKEYIKEAESRFSQNDYKGAVINAVIAFEWAFNASNKALIKSSYSPPAFQHDIQSWRDDNYELRGVVGYLNIYFDKLTRWVKDENNKKRELTAVIAYGLDIKMYQKFSSLAPNVDFSIGGNPWIDLKPNKYTEDDANFVLQYCIDSIMQLESAVGDLAAPFGEINSSKLVVDDFNYE